MSLSLLFFGFDGLTLHPCTISRRFWVREIQTACEHCTFSLCLWRWRSSLLWKNGYLFPDESSNLAIQEDLGPFCSQRHLHSSSAVSTLTSTCGSDITVIIFWNLDEDKHLHWSFKAFKSVLNEAMNAIISIRPSLLYKTLLGVIQDWLTWSGKSQCARVCVPCHSGILRQALQPRAHSRPRNRPLRMHWRFNYPFTWCSHLHPQHKCISKRCLAQGAGITLANLYASLVTSLASAHDSHGISLL